MLEIGSLVKHTSGSIGIVLYISPHDEAIHHIEVWIAGANETRWWSLEHTEVL